LGHDVLNAKQSTDVSSLGDHLKHKAFNMARQVVKSDMYDVMCLNLSSEFNKYEKFCEFLSNKNISSE